MVSVRQKIAIEYIARPHDLKDPDAYGILVIGESMIPAYRKGHRVVVSPRSVAQGGDEVYVQLTDGRRMIKVAHKISGGWRWRAPEFAPIEVSHAQVVNIHPIVWARRRIPGCRVIDEQTGRKR